MNGKQIILVLIVAVFAAVLGFMLHGSSSPSATADARDRSPATEAASSSAADTDADRAAAASTSTEDADSAPHGNTNTVEDTDSAPDGDTSTVVEDSEPGSTANTNSASLGEGGFGPTKQVEIIDPFFDMAAFTVTIPRNWVFEGTVLHGPGCVLDYQSVAYRAYSPDMAYGVQLVPTQSWYWADDERARPEGPGCKYLPPMSPADYAAIFAARMRPGAEFDASELTPDADQFYANIEKNNERLAAQARAYNVPAAHDTGGAARVRIHYEWEGHAEEEWLTVTMVYNDLARNMLVYPGNGRPGRPTWVRYQGSNATLIGRRAPKGKLNQYDPALIGIAQSLTENPEHEAAMKAHLWDQVRRKVAAGWQITHTIVQASQAQMRINQQNAQAFMANQQRQHQQFMANMEHRGDVRHQNFMAQMNAQTAHARDVQDYLLDQQYYVNPATGETSTQSGRYNHTWTNGPGSSNSTGVVQNNGPNYNPNGVYRGNWTELQPIHH